MSDARARNDDRRRLAREAVEREREANATPDTLRHWREDIVDTMWRKGQLIAEQRRAANEIAEIYMHFAKQGAARVQDYAPRIASGLPATDWRAGVISAYKQRYQPWRDEAGAQSVGAGRVVFDLVVAVAVDNLGFQQTADKYRMDRRTVQKRVRESLMRYAEIAGWVDECGRAKVA